MGNLFRWYTTLDELLLTLLNDYTLMRRWPLLTKPGGRCFKINTTSASLISTNLPCPCCNTQISNR